MPEEVKFTEEELKQVQTIQQGYADIQTKFGQLKMAHLRLEQQQNSLYEENDKLEEKLKSLQNEEKKFLDSVNEKYGEGTLNPETGVFTPIESENKSE